MEIIENFCIEEAKEWGLWIPEDGCKIVKFIENETIGYFGIFGDEPNSTICINPKYRGKGYFNKIYNKGMKYFKLNQLKAIVDIDNKESINAHNKIGIVAKRVDNKIIYLIMQPIEEF